MFPVNYSGNFIVQAIYVLSFILFFIFVDTSKDFTKLLNHPVSWVIIITSFENIIILLY